MPGSSEVVFATSNRHKVAEVERILAEFDLKVKPADVKGVEIQSEDISIVAAYASRGAANSAGQPIVVEDSGIAIDSLDGFPGPYSSYSYTKIGVQGILRLMRDLPRRGAVFRSVVAYCEPGGEPRLFEGAVRGRIAIDPAGSEGFGFDPIFVPEGSVLTLAEMTIEEKCRVSHRALSFRRFGTWFTQSGGNP